MLNNIPLHVPDNTQKPSLSLLYSIDNTTSRALARLDFFFPILFYPAGAHPSGTNSVGPGKYIFRDYKIVAHISDTTKDYHDTSVIEWPTANHVAWDKLTQWRYHDSNFSRQTTITVWG